MVALVTIDNGEDHTKPTFFGRAALESLERLLAELEEGDWDALVLTGKPFVFAAGADIDEFPGATRELAIEGSRAGHELFGRIRALPYPDRRRDQRRLPRRRRRDRAALRRAHDLDGRAALRLPGVLPRDRPGLGRHAARAAARRRGDGGQVHRREPACARTGC